ncbi:MAG: flagellin lysine-N-methylase [Lachnospiraceae bacterium]|nr:flagellin lysine-N-methylase [Lachnospiraceae bacterium]
MSLKKIFYYDEFSCAGGKCPDNCCHGWSIPLDEAARQRFLKEKGLLGLSLRLCMRGKEQKIFSAMSISCPFLTPGGWCSLQKRRGEEFIPDVCREYPRIRMNYGPEAEFLLDLSCIRMAELFLQHLDENELKEAEQCELPEQYGDNDDETYFRELLDWRREIVSRIRSSAEGGAETLNNCLSTITAHAYEVQGKMLKGEETGVLSDICAEKKTASLFPLSINAVNEMMSTCFFEGWMQYSAPFLYRLCKMYYRGFDRLNYRQGEKKLSELFEKHIASDPHMVKILAEYFISTVNCRFLQCYEDYSPYRRLTDGLISMNLIMLFYMLWAAKYGPPPERTLAHIISVTEKRVFHNDMALKDLHAALQPEVFGK